MSKASKSVAENDKLVPIGTRITESTKLKFDNYCRSRGIKLGWQVEELIKEFLEKNKPSYRELFVKKTLESLKTLDDILNLLTTEYDDDENQILEMDVLACLPVFGHKNYTNDEYVWSWDDTHKIIGSGEDFEIVKISESEHKAKHLSESDENED